MQKQQFNFESYSWSSPQNWDEKQRLKNWNLQISNELLCEARLVTFVSYKAEKLSYDALQQSTG